MRVPHVNDKAVYRECVELLGGPKSYHDANRVDGRRILDTDLPGQQRFQAMLFRCFNSPDREHPWDVMTGRNFGDLRSYLGWVSPHQERLVISATVAPLVASYLLPYTRIHADGAADHSGIPGLRLDGCTKTTVRLVHLPTGGVLDLRHTRTFECADAMRKDLEHEVEFSRSRMESFRNRVAVWREPALTRGEQMAAEHWEEEPGTPLLSALMARARLFWLAAWDATVLRPGRRSNSAGRVAWRSGHYTNDLGALLVGRAVGIPGALFEPAEREYEPGLLRLGGYVVELDGPEPPSPKMLTLLRRA